jgi:hypothetical protein
MTIRMAADDQARQVEKLAHIAQAEALEQVLKSGVDPKTV